MIRIKIVSDGTPHGTVITNTETGEPLGGVSSVSFVATLDGTEALVGFRDVECDIITHAQVDNWLAVEDEGWVEIKGRMPKVVDEDWEDISLMEHQLKKDWAENDRLEKLKEKPDGGPTTDED